MVRKNKELKMVKWNSCPNPTCGSTQPPLVIKTDVHITWGTKVNEDGTIVRNRTHKPINDVGNRTGGVEDDVTFIVCSVCSATIWDNVATDDKYNLVRTTASAGSKRASTIEEHRKEEE